MISIIMPAYNSANYIEQALQSLFVQTYQDFEIIVIDDGSTDNTKVVLEPYRAKLRYVYKENGGEASARNYGFSLAKGEYIAFLDADDFYKPNKLEQQIKVFKSDPSIDVVYNDVEVVNENLKYISTLKSEGVYETKEDFLCMLLVRQIVPATASMMFKRKCIERGLRYPEHYKNAVDYDFTIKLAEYYKFKYLAETLYVYRRHSGNLTNNHIQQIETEALIIKSLGFGKIKDIVRKSGFNTYTKDFILAKIFIKINEWKKAKDILSNLADRDNNPAIWFFLGNCYYAENNFTNALLFYEKAICKLPKMAEAYNNIGCMYGFLKQFDNAKKNFETALSIRNEYMDAKYNLKQLINNTHNYKITIRQLREVLTVY